MNLREEKPNLKVIDQKDQTEIPAKVTVKDLLIKMVPDMKKVLPKYMTPERMTRIVMGEIRKNEKLQMCTIESLGASIMKAAEVGLEPSSTLGHAYLMPMQNSKNINGNWVKTWEAELVIGYKGYIVLAARSGIKIHASEICKNDLFDYEEGTNPFIHHKRALNNRGEVIAYYAIAEEKDGSTRFSLLGADEILEHAKKNSKSYDSKSNKFRGPWQNHFHSMAKKTAIKDLMTYLPYENREEVEDQQEQEQQPQQPEPRKTIVPGPPPTIEEALKIRAGGNMSNEEMLGDHDRFGAWDPNKIY